MAKNIRPTIAVSSPAPQEIGIFDSIGQGTSRTFQMVGKTAEVGHRSMDLVCRKVIKAQCVTALDDATEIHYLREAFPGGPEAADAILGPILAQ
mgnify:CR=1 FL=1|jgi:hypothetical protein